MTNLVLALLETPRPLSLREIGTAVAGYPDAPGPLRQAFERDKRTLRDGGIPIDVERIDGDDQVGYRILPEQYYLADLGLDEAETEAIAFALAAVRLDGTTTVDIAQKLGATSPTLPPLAVLPALAALGPLQQAIRTRATSDFSYRGRARVVEGYGLVFRQGAWYLVGKDRTAAPDGAIRSFRVDRIESEVQSGAGEAYVIPPGFDAGSELRLAPFATTAGAAEAIEEAVVEIDARSARPVVALLGEQAVDRRDRDGSVAVRVGVSDEEAFISFVLGLGDAAEVVSPAPLRQLVIDRLRRAVAASEGVVA
jgi:predicted DNA-binding transcriptional regulator YafY